MFPLSRRQCLRVPVSVLFCLFLAAPFVVGQASPRITQTVRNDSRVALKGSVSARVGVAADQGSAPGSMTLSHLRLVLRRNDAQETALKQYLAELQQKSSANYHRWLTPEQFGALYGPADSDIAVITAWLQSQGLTVGTVAKGRVSIDFSGTTSAVEQAFQTPIHSYLDRGEPFFSNTADPSIPSALEPVIAGAILNTIQPKPLLHAPLQRGSMRSGKSRSQATDSSAATPRPQVSFGNGTVSIGPADAATIYNTPNRWNGNFAGGVSYTGVGATIGIIGDASFDITPVVNYRSLFLGNSIAPTIINVDGVSTPPDSDTEDAYEAYIDLEVSGGMAPDAALDFYTSTSLYSSVERALEDNTADILSVSFIACELYFPDGENFIWENLWQQSAAQGIAVTVATGDTGSANCDLQWNNGTISAAASQGLAVNGIASTPYNIAVGGSDFMLSASTFYNYATSPDTGFPYYRTAKGYIPESTWNDSTLVNTTIAANTSLDKVGYSTIFAGGGGPSNCSTNTTSLSSTHLGTCISGYAKPTWQRGTGVPGDGVRDLPDVAFMSGSGQGYAVWLVCNYGLPDCSITGTGENGRGFWWGSAGGTSVAAPAFAGMLALVQQKEGGRLGQAAENLYSLFNGPHASAIFHDITVGNNSVPCVAGSPNCVQNAAGYYFESGYDTNPGYDLATGLGSVDVTNLIAYWDTGTGVYTATVTVTPSPTTISTTAPVNVLVTVSGSSATPTGSIVLSGGSYTSNSTALSNGSATIAIPANTFAAGTVTLTASYSGDQNYSSATGSASLTVTTGSQSSTTSLTASPSIANLGAAVTLSAVVSPAAATGNITFYDGSNALGSQALNSGVASMTTSTLALGSHTLTAAYSGDATYASSTSSAVIESIVQSGAASFSLSASPSTLTVAKGSSGSATITVTPAGGYTGTVTLSCTVANSTNTSNPPSCTGSTVAVTSSAAVTGTITLQTTAASSALRAPLLPGRKLPWYAISSGLLLAVVLTQASRRRRWYCVLALVLALAVLATMDGCASGTSAGPGSSTGTGTTAGSYTVTVVGTDSKGITYSIPLTLTVD